MTIVFMGTPDFAVPSLRKLLGSPHRVVAVVTAPDEARGRGQKVTPTPVKAAALDAGIPVLQPASLRDPAFIDALRALSADVFVVVAFRILPREVFTLPARGSFNLHASLLPKYRGAAPINWALINGETESGVTSFFLKEKVDTGTVILQERLAAPPDMTAGELHDALSMLGAEVVLRTVDAIADGTAVARDQDDALATPAPKIFRDTCAIDWSRSAPQLHNFIRGLSPFPGAWTRHGERVLKIYRTRVSDTGRPLPPGSVLAHGGSLIVHCGDGALDILELKQEGRKAMNAAEFLRGYRFEEDARIG
ncbi:MAG: methionyl-tRNA formyltransferase [Ignavibacteria bacterium]|nr:methionyl-tRNA formyltransferase [Ignavibacteria bacterium]